MIRTIVGIDNGLSGAICCLDNETDEVQFALTPTSEKPPTRAIVGKTVRRKKQKKQAKSKRFYDFPGMRQLMLESSLLSVGEQTIAIIEDTIHTHSGRIGNQTSEATRESLELGKAFWTAACVDANVALWVVKPNTWQSAMKLLRSDKKIHVLMTQAFGVTLPMRQVSKQRSEFNHDAADAFLLAKCFQMHFLDDALAWERENSESVQ